MLDNPPSGLRLVRFASAAPMRTATIVGGVSLGPRTLGVNNKDVNTLFTAIAERVMLYRKGAVVYQPLEPKENAFRKLIQFKRKLLAIYGDKPSPLEPHEFVECYKGRKKTIYANALHEWTGGVTTSHARLKAFVKAEKVDTSKAPRVIQPRSPVYNIGVGCYLKHIEHPLYVAMARLFKQPFVVSKGLNVQELGRGLNTMWGEIPNPVFIGFDCSRFDMHVTVDALKWEHSVYKSLYNYSPELVRLLQMQLVNYGTGHCADGKVSYKVLGRRMSGDMNTALGNCLIVCAIVYAYMKTLGVDYRFVDNGDDCGVIISRNAKDKVAGIVSWFEDFGFRLELEDPVIEFEKITFCQMKPVFDGVGYVMVRDFYKALEKDSFSIHPHTSAKSLRKWLYAVGECGLSLCSGIPVMQSFYEMYLRCGLPSNMKNATYMECGAMHLAKGLDPKRRNVTEAARHSFYVAFGVLPADQVILEKHFANVTLGQDGGLRELCNIPTFTPTRLDHGPDTW